MILKVWRWRLGKTCRKKRRHFYGSCQQTAKNSGRAFQIPESKWTWWKKVCIWRPTVIQVWWHTLCAIRTKPFWKGRLQAPQVHGQVSSLCIFEKQTYKNILRAGELDHVRSSFHFRPPELIVNCFDQWYLDIIVYFNRIWSCLTSPFAHLVA